ncbi:MAG: hypothetical protein UR96_C0024G0004 [candidate division WS6 bacterium GW2011_GWC1_36_11]|uniref:SprT-like domain-containing protein n=2 Tax=Candidatus Dojkabacteria TaxID=74243 RepID=A0A0G0FX35_9BACT|nr:MAG: hypothetical protein UR96_C0024G0004 [candidate division WS6 bacterium GW2011_GWC1_36_11]KKQ11655.1 MAG: hypothetical protein US24_C0020G0011 [candidate division WS6 bacterium GW2011_GWC2_36_7]
MRDRKYLENLMYDLWEEYFSDIPRKNLVLIKFGKYSKRQLGSIKIANEYTKIKSLLKKNLDDYDVQDDKRVTVITMTKYFQNEIVPEYVVSATIAHELCHYAHGFSSPLEKRFDKPHQGNVINKELAKRGLLESQRLADKWLKDNWVGIVYPLHKFF